MVKRRRRVAHQTLLVAVVLVERAIHDETDRHRAEMRLQVGGQVTEGSRRDQGRGATVLDDVASFFGLEMPVDRRGVESRSLRTPEHLEVPRVVLEEYRDVIARLQ